jgi:hypothetical protein
VLTFVFFFAVSRRGTCGRCRGHARAHSPDTEDPWVASSSTPTKFSPGPPTKPSR